MTDRAAARAERREREQPSGWAIGWLVFGATAMILLGIWWFIVGIAALASDEFVVATEDYVFSFDTTTWGWLTLGLGAIVTIAGFVLFTGAVWAQVVTVVVASFAAIVGFALLPLYPIGAVLIIALAIAVVWAVVAHGRDIPAY